MRPGKDYMGSEDNLNLQFYFFAKTAQKDHLST